MRGGRSPLPSKGTLYLPFAVFTTFGPMPQ